MILRTLCVLTLFAGMSLSSMCGLCQERGYAISIREEAPSLRGRLHLTLSNNTSVKMTYLIDLQGMFEGEWQGCMLDVFSMTWDRR